jgi:aminoglycoside 3-N-acetyltransferase
MNEPADRISAALDRFPLAGRIVFVHSSWSEMAPLAKSPLQLLDALYHAVGDGGTVVMPTYPMRNEELSDVYLASNRRFDWRRTPSQVGLLTELFRRVPGTRRSLHPTHSVAARGARATELTEGHELCPTPFDENSPFHRMYEGDAVVLCLGVRTMSFRHLADHLLQDSLDHDVYSSRRVRVLLLDELGNKCWMETRGHNPGITCDHEVVLDRLREEGGITRLAVGTSQLELTPVRSYVERHHRCYREGELRFCSRDAEELRLLTADSS